ncbi:conserved hypothetical protein [Theileria orientalis strain Shintoku]|uniref:Uncharacterized protein n=1 Tax=Theileria orientalis strain Shintoku TaxID=869250 RepID=J4DA05_THEOR|nr:conserved hypothetical protein [Theileria orientalis strain Shintoku]PVC53657.1 hypothetical protein MACL_00003621 [Theileria orientalis]BAM41705.1 conserved hypothetical protein [Theileria orientalis strain Shintoku]|eukprot:XP_009692006.1 conserved hypothetical protein [Theileria orientalis strain Shintoku]
MKKNGNRSSADSSLKVDESGKKSEKVMVPFFESDESTVSISLKPPRSSQSRRSRFSKGHSDPHPPRNSRFPGRKDSSKPPSTKEVGLNGEPSRVAPNDASRGSWPLPNNVNGAHVFASSNVVVPETRIAYIDRNNVGNIRPLAELYDKNGFRAPPEAPGDVVHKIKREFKPSLNCELDPIGRQSTFVDALIRNSNSFEDVVVDDSHRFDRSGKSQELKSVLTKMGILDKTHSQKDDSSFPELEKDLGNRYVFPKYMTSPDPSSIPIPGSL